MSDPDREWSIFQELFRFTELHLTKTIDLTLKAQNFENLRRHAVFLRKTVVEGGVCVRVRTCMPNEDSRAFPVASLFAVVL